MPKKVKKNQRTYPDEGKPEKEQGKRTYPSKKKSKRTYGTRRGY